MVSFPVATLAAAAVLLVFVMVLGRLGNRYDRKAGIGLPFLPLGPIVIFSQKKIDNLIIIIILVLVGLFVGGCALAALVVAPAMLAADMLTMGLAGHLSLAMFGLVALCFCTEAAMRQYVRWRVGLAEYVPTLWWVARVVCVVWALGGIAWGVTTLVRVNPGGLDARGTLVQAGLALAAPLLSAGALGYLLYRRRSSSIREGRMCLTPGGMVDTRIQGDVLSRVTTALALGDGGERASVVQYAACWCGISAAACTDRSAYFVELPPRWRRVRRRFDVVPFDAFDGLDCRLPVTQGSHVKGCFQFKTAGNVRLALQWRLGRGRRDTRLAPLVAAHKVLAGVLKNIGPGLRDAIRKQAAAHAGTLADTLAHPTEAVGDPAAVCEECLSCLNGYDMANSIAVRPYAESQVACLLLTANIRTLGLLDGLAAYFNATTEHPQPDVALAVVRVCHLWVRQRSVLAKAVRRLVSDNAYERVNAISHIEYEITKLLEALKARVAFELKRTQGGKATMRRWTRRRLLRLVEGQGLLPDLQGSSLWEGLAARLQARHVANSENVREELDIWGLSREDLVSVPDVQAGDSI